MKKPYILAYTAVFSATGGAQYTMSLLSQELAKRDYAIRFFTRPPHNPDHRYSRMLSEVGVPVNVLLRLDDLSPVKIAANVFSAMFVLPYALLRWRSLANAWQSLKAIFFTVVAKLEKRYILGRLDDGLEEGKSQQREVILHVFGPAMLTPLLLEWSKEKGVPSIYHEMGEADEQYIKMFSMEGTVGSVNRADLVISLTPAVAANMRRVFGYKGRLETIYAMIGDPGDDWVKGKKNGGRVTFGAISRLVPHKRHSDLLHAIKTLSDQGYDTALVIAGDGPMRGLLEELSAELGITDRVTFLGEFENLEEVMAQFDIFTLFSTSESQCMPVTESMAYGKPVVVSDFGGIPDFVQHGVTGFLVPVGDRSQLIASMKELLDNPALREAMGNQARENFVRFFAPARVVDLYERIYESLQTPSEAKEEQTIGQLVFPSS